MSREKQIEEMAKDMCIYGTKCYDDGIKCEKTSCKKCEIAHGVEYFYAKALYNAGYRKQSEGKWEKRTFIIFDSEKVGYRCSECNTTWDDETKFCPNCGAHMKGGAD